MSSARIRYLNLDFLITVFSWTGSIRRKACSKCRAVVERLGIIEELCVKGPLLIFFFFFFFKKMHKKMHIEHIYLKGVSEN